MRIAVRWLLVLALLLPATAAAAQPIKLKLNFFSSDRSETYRNAIKPFVDAVNAEANGLIEIEVYFSGALGKDPSKAAQEVRDGVADIAVMVTGLAPDAFPDNVVLEMPGLFRDSREATYVFTRLIAANALKGYDDFYVIGSHATDPETIHARAPVASLKDLKGLRIATNNPTLGAVLEKLGMRAVILSVNKYVNALASDQIDAVAKSPSVLFDFGIARLATYHYMLRTSVLPMALLMNRKTFEALPEAAQEIIRKYSGEWSAARFVEITVEIDRNAMKALTSDPKRHVIFPSPADLKTAQDTFNSFIAEWAEKSPHNNKLLGLVENELAKFRLGR